MYVPAQRVRPRSISRTMREIPAFRRWIKKRHCSVKGCQNADIDPAHIRCDLPADALKAGTNVGESLTEEIDFIEKGVESLRTSLSTGLPKQSRAGKTKVSVKWS